MLIQARSRFYYGGGALQAPSVTADEALAGGPDPRMTYVIAVRGIKSYPKPTGKNAGRGPRGLSCRGLACGCERLGRGAEA